jgi:NAD dependent epimerase/dehydratase family enzyme
VTPRPSLGVAIASCRDYVGGTIAGGRQFVSWIHHRDLVRAVELLIERDDRLGPINLAAPGPLPQRDFIAALRAAWGARAGLPATAWMVSLGAFLLRTDPELLRKSRRVVPGRLLAAGFCFELPTWPQAARDLVAHRRAHGAVGAVGAVGPGGAR